MPTIGNDIVDLKAPENKGKSRDRRFLARVFTPEEQAVIKEAIDPDAILWAIWAAKEGAYKALSKGDDLLPSIPRRYIVIFSGENQHLNDRRANADEEEIILTGEVHTPAGPVSFRTLWAAGYIHCLVIADAGNDTKIFEHVWDFKGDTDPSNELRQAARTSLASLLGVRPTDLEIRRLRTALGDGPPQVLLKGCPTDVDISLSHDGVYGAAAFCWPMVGESDRYVPADSYRSRVMSLFPSTATRVSLPS